MTSELTRPPSASEDVRLPKLHERLKGSSSRASTEPKAHIPGVLNRGECVDSMLICRAFGVFAPKVYRGVLKMGVPESKPGRCPHPRRGSQQPLFEVGAG